MKTANVIVMAVTGLVLVAASGLKIEQLLTEPIISRSFWGSWEFFLIQIPFELGLGIWLLCGIFRKAGWLTAVAVFGVFILATLQRGLIGAESCGCFGRVHVNPWITLATIDIPLLAALLVFRPKSEKLLPPPWPSARVFFGVAVPTFILMAIIMPVLILNKLPDETETYKMVKPEEWGGKGAGKELPMLMYIDIAESLRSNIVVAVFYNNECESCHEVVPLYDKMSRDMVANQEAVRFAFIEIPPYAAAHESLIPADTASLTGRLDSSKQWYILTPLVVVMRDGQVVKFWEGEAPNLDEILDAVFANG